MRPPFQTQRGAMIGWTREGLLPLDRRTMGRTGRHQRRAAPVCEVVLSALTESTVRCSNSDAAPKSPASRATGFRRGSRRERPPIAEAYSEPLFTVVSGPPQAPSARLERNLASVADEAQTAWIIVPVNPGSDRRTKPPTLSRPGLWNHSPTSRSAATFQAPPRCALAESVSAKDRPPSSLTNVPPATPWLCATSPTIRACVPTFTRCRRSRA